MNYNTLAFAPTAAAERLARGHWLNTRTYGLIATVVILQSTLIFIDWIRSETEKMPEYSVRLQLTKLKTQRYFVRRAIAVLQFSERHQLSQKAINALDSVFALN